jgi:hypothetical protein
MSTRTNYTAFSIATAALTLATAVTLPLALASQAFASDARKKTITVNLRDDSAYLIELHSGELDYALSPGHTLSLKLHLGDEVTTRNSTPNYPAGTRVLLATPYLNGTTVALH